VLSVGNIAVGGTGKTPFVIWLARRLREAGHHPGILARGYGGKAAGSGAPNDEGAVIAQALGAEVPQVQDPDRVRGGRGLLAAFPAVDVLLLDDGFQHRRLARDLDIVLLDCTNPFGFGFCLPRGRLREPPRALKRAGAVVLTRSERVSPDVVKQLAARVEALSKAPLAVALSEPWPAGLAAKLSGARVLACCGIGNPQAFLGTLADLGAIVVAQRILRDHEALPVEAWPGLIAQAKAAGAEGVVITAKDAVKVRGLPAEVTVVDVKTVLVQGQSTLWERVAAALSGQGPA